MFNKIFFISFFSVVISFFSISSNAIEPVNEKFRYPVYLGVTGGYGATTWGNLVPNDPNAAMSLSTPIRVNEGGGVWGVYAGYELIPFFALEASFMRYPEANVFFDPMSLFSFFHDDMTEMTTHTDTISLVGKFMLFIPHTNIRAYSSVGAAEVHRYDPVVNRWRLSPMFGAGFNYNFTQRIMAELGTEYVAGYGQSEVDPSSHYIPFLYSVFLRLAVRL